jgi:hypothetical protein
MQASQIQACGGFDTLTAIRLLKFCLSLPPPKESELPGLNQNQEMIALSKDIPTS